MVLRGNGGALSTAVVAALAGLGGTDGLFGVAAFDPYPLVRSCDEAGRFGGGGGGARLPTPGGGAWKFFCWLRAAILSAKVVNWGSSTSAMPAVGSKLLQSGVTKMSARGRGYDVLLFPILVQSSYLRTTKATDNEGLSLDQNDLSRISLGFINSH